jgi:hypothetical protein
VSNNNTKKENSVWLKKKTRSEWVKLVYRMMMDKKREEIEREREKRKK